MTRRPNQRRSWGPYLLGGLLGISLGSMLVVYFVVDRANRLGAGVDGEGTALAGTAAETGDFEPASIDQSRENAIVRATERVNRSVVSVTVLQVEKEQVLQRYRTWFRDFLVPREQLREYHTLGSGVILSPDGYIVTNEHVVQSASQILVTLWDGREFPARIVGKTREYDLAVLKIDADDLPHAAMGDSEDLKIGEWAIAIGSPFGAELGDTRPTVTVGVISALHRDIRQDSKEEEAYYFDMIQTDAAINPGNSGGPLVNSRGQVIGINSFIFSIGQAGNIGIGFAIPSRTVDWIYEEVKEYGRLRQVFIGLRVVEVSRESPLGQGLDLKEDRALVVSRINVKSPAYQAGVRQGDVILEFNGVKQPTLSAARRSLYTAKVGDTLEMVVRRHDSIKRFEFTLTEYLKQVKA
jgi:serine protease Do